MRKINRRKKPAQKLRAALKLAIEQDPKTRAEHRKLIILQKSIAAILLDHEATLQQQSAAKGARSQAAH